MSATLLQMVNRVRRKIKWDDVSSFTASDSLTNVLIDFLNEAKRDVLENYEHDFDIRTDGVIQTIAPLTYTAAVGQVSSTTGSATVLVVGANDYATVTAGNSRSRLAITSDANFGTTYLNILTGRHPGASDSYVLETTWPGTTFGLTDLGSAEILTAEYSLPTTVRDVLSVMVEESEVMVEFVDKAETLDSAIPNAFQLTSSIPEVCFVGGTVTPTVTFGSTATPALGIWIYPVPSEVYVLRYTYRYRHPELTATTDTLYVPDHIVDIIVDLAVARVMQTRVAPDLEAARQIEGTTLARLARSVRRTSMQPLQHMSLRSLDRRGSGIPLSGSPRNPRVFYTP